MNDRSNFEILSLNIRSLSKNVELFRAICNQKLNPTVIVLSETWPTNETELFENDSYQSIFALSFKNKACAAAIFVKNYLHVIEVNLDFNVCFDLIFNVCFEH